MRLRIASHLPLLATLLLLGGIVAQTAVSNAQPADAADYQRGVRVAADALPLAAGPWMGEAVPVPTQAQDALQANVLISRRYRNVLTGRALTLLIVQVADSRKLVGHYPPVCYPGQGWRLESAEPRDWRARGLPVPGTLYTFSAVRHGAEQALRVANFMVLPTGRIGRDMADVEAVASDRSLMHFGAAEVQVVFEGPPDDGQDAAIDALLSRCRGVIDAVLRGNPSGERPAGGGREAAK